MKMKISFLYPVKIEKDGDVQIQLEKIRCNTNEKFTFALENKGIDWKVFNYKLSVIIIGSINNKKWYWCNAIPYKAIYNKFPILKSDSQRFNKKGFNRVLLESIFNSMGINKSLEKIDVDGFKDYVMTDYGVKI